MAAYHLAGLYGTLLGKWFEAPDMSSEQGKQPSTSMETTLQGATAVEDVTYLIVASCTMEER